MMLQMGTQVAWQSTEGQDSQAAGHQAQLLFEELLGLMQNLSFPNHKMGVQVLSLTPHHPYRVNTALQKK